MPKYQVLSLDGGGVRGLITARLLERLANEPGLKNVFDSVDLIAGNSSGGLIALAMARARAGKVPMIDALKEIREVFEDGDQVFGWKVPFPIGFLFLSRYFPFAKKRELQKRLQNTKLRELGTKVLITAFDLNNDAINRGKETLCGRPRRQPIQRWKAKVFHNFLRADLEEPRDGDCMSDRDRLARDVALYSTAAPAFFPTADGFVDGGVYANNPSMCALAQLYDNRYEPMPKRPLSDIVMFSVGAGLNATVVNGKNHYWGLLQWFVPVSLKPPFFQNLNRNFVAMVNDATVGIADYQCRQMLGDENYHRLQVEFGPGVAFAIDETASIEKILGIANKEDIGPCAEWLARYWMPRQRLVPVLSEATSKHVLSTVELTVLMPIKAGFVDVFETHTYATRLRNVLRGLHTLRQAAREARDVRVFPDIVDLIGSIHAFHLSIIESRQLLLTVTFDRPWEPYFRLVWSRLGALLDLILINCDGYKDHVSSKGFDHFIQWVREHQVEAELFYASSAQTVDDLTYLRELERMVRVEGPAKIASSAALLRIESPDATAAAAGDLHNDEVIDQGLIALATFYKLRDLYRDEGPDAEYLRSAAFATLATFRTDFKFSQEQHEAYRRELEWFDEIIRKRGSRQAPVFGQIDNPLRTDTPRPPEFEQIQGGIVRGLAGVRHGVLLLARIEDPDRARAFLRDTLTKRITWHDGKPVDNVFTNVAFTLQGLQRLGLAEADLAAFPKEFREGMEARSGMLGDVRGNHPDNWELPEWNWEPPEPMMSPLPRIRLSTVDLVIHLRSSDPTPPADTWEQHPLFVPAHTLVGDPNTTGIRVMSRQEMAHHRDTQTDLVREHFGFIDGISQPQYPPLALGEFVLGYENERNDPPFFDEDDTRAVKGRTRGSWLDNGTFLVARKLEQHVDVFCNLLATIERALAQCHHSGPVVSAQDILAKLMGRQRNDGTPLTDPQPARGLRRQSIHNDFHYTDDTGLRCPLHAHIRRGNPRTNGTPRIARRGMAYGPPFETKPEAERGMMFLAYNASIAEQFEVIQRWMTGGNSTGGFSGSVDPFLRVPQKDQRDVFLVPYEDDVIRIDLPHEPLVSLKWGMYLFVPSIAALERLALAPLPDEDKRLGTVARGERTIAALQTDDEWSTILEDSSAIHSGRTAAVCAAIREFHGGVYRTPGGGMVLVASHQAVEEVLRCDELYSVSEYRNRMNHSIGEIYLGLDQGEDYRRLSTRPNAAISSVSIRDAFEIAHKTAQARLYQVRTHTEDDPIRLSLEPIVDATLAQLAEHWLAIPDGELVREGGRPEDGGTDRSVRCPFHTLAPSRFIFSSPKPRAAVRAAGMAHGDTLRQRITLLAEQKHRKGEWPGGLPFISRTVWESICGEQHQKGPTIDFDLFARMMVGVLEGFLPTVYGNAQKILHLWLTDATFWRIQQDLLLSAERDVYQRASETVLPELRRAMQTRPVPDMIYRTATEPARLGDVRVDQGDRIVLLISSAVQELAERNQDDVYPVFGGNRALTPHPTHACPAYAMGLGTTLGILTAILEAGSFAPNPTPLVVNFSTAPRGDKSADREERFVETG